MANLDPVFYTTITDGKMATHNRDKLLDYIATRPDGNYEIILRKPRKPRSTAENNYYFGVVVYMISQETGFSTQEAHEAMKWLFLKKQVNKLTTVRSTADLSTVEMEEYLANVRQFAAQELNIYIPLPNEVDYERQ